MLSSRISQVGIETARVVRLGPTQTALLKLASPRLILRIGPRVAVLWAPIRSIIITIICIVINIVISVIIVGSLIDTNRITFAIVFLSSPRLRLARVFILKILRGNYFQHLSLKIRKAVIFNDSEETVGRFREFGDQFINNVLGGQAKVRQRN